MKAPRPDAFQNPRSEPPPAKTRANHRDHPLQRPGWGNLCQTPVPVAPYSPMAPADNTTTPSLASTDGGDDLDAATMAVGRSPTDPPRTNADGGVGDAPPL